MILQVMLGYSAEISPDATVSGVVHLGTQISKMCIHVWQISRSCLFQSLALTLDKRSE